MPKVSYSYYCHKTYKRICNSSTQLYHPCLKHMLHNDIFEIFDNLNFRLSMVSSDSLMSLYFLNFKFNALKLLTYSVTSKADYIFVPWE